MSDVNKYVLKLPNNLRFSLFIYLRYISMYFKYIKFDDSNFIQCFFR